MFLGRPEMQKKNGYVKLDLLLQLSVVGHNKTLFHSISASLVIIEVLTRITKYILFDHRI